MRKQDNFSRIVPHSPVVNSPRESPTRRCPSSAQSCNMAPLSGIHVPDGNLGFYTTSTSPLYDPLGTPLSGRNCPITSSSLSSVLISKIYFLNGPWCKIWFAWCDPRCNNKLEENNQFLLHVSASLVHFILMISRTCFSQTNKGRRGAIGLHWIACLMFTVSHASLKGSETYEWYIVTTLAS